MQKNLQLIPSGISLIDEGWGGLYKSSNYLLIGTHKSGKTHFGLNFLLQGAAQKEKCLFFTSKPDTELFKLAEWMNLELNKYVKNGFITIVNVIPPEKGFYSVNTDLAISEYFDDVIMIIEKYFPSRIVFDEITRFIRFKDGTLLQLILEKFHNKLEEQEITGIIVSSEPVTEIMSAQLQNLADLCNGLIYLDKEINDLYGTISLLPYFEHKSGEIKSNYVFDRQRGLQIDLSVLKRSDTKIVG